MGCFQKCFLAVLAILAVVGLSCTNRGTGCNSQGVTCSTRGITNTTGGTTNTTGSTTNTSMYAMNGIWEVCAARGAANASLTPTNMLTPAQIQVMQTLMGTHHHRVMHSLWHLMRTALTWMKSILSCNLTGRNGGIPIPNAQCQRTP